jgi:deazaflavin-dependent oxidoreductase (nitroreductase family)
VRRYREAGGEVGHIWRRGSNAPAHDEGRKTGKPRTTPLIYERVGDAFVIVASKGGAQEHPGRHQNLAKEPAVEVQVKNEVFTCKARTATGKERERPWKLAAQQWPDYDAYRTGTDREIPVVVLEPA